MLSFYCSPLKISHTACILHNNSLVRLVWHRSIMLQFYRVFVSKRIYFFVEQFYGILFWKSHVLASLLSINYCKSFLFFNRKALFVPHWNVYFPERLSFCASHEFLRSFVVRPFDRPCVRGKREREITVFVRRRRASAIVVVVEVNIIIMSGKKKEKKLKTIIMLMTTALYYIRSADRPPAAFVRSPSVQCDLNVKRVPASRCIIRTKDTYSRVAINATAGIVRSRERCWGEISK